MTHRHTVCRNGRARGISPPQREKHSLFSANHALPKGESLISPSNHQHVFAISRFHQNYIFHLFLNYNSIDLVNYSVMEMNKIKDLPVYEKISDFIEKLKLKYAF